MGTWPARRDLDEEFRLFAGAQRPALYRVALVLTADPGLAEDLVQTALMRTHARWPRRMSTDVAARVAERDAVLRALQGLTYQERRVVVLRFLEDFSEADTAKTLSIPLGTVKSVTHRAIAKLRESADLDRRREANP